MWSWDQLFKDISKGLQYYVVWFLAVFFTLDYLPNFQVNFIPVFSSRFTKSCDPQWTRDTLLVFYHAGKDEISKTLLIVLEHYSMG